LGNQDVARGSEEGVGLWVKTREERMATRGIDTVNSRCKEDKMQGGKKRKKSEEVMSKRSK
jgi:hypothetical protein